MAAPQKTLNSTSATATATVKFLCSYGGRILPRPSDCRLRYAGGLTRVVSVDRSVSFSELMAKLRDLCGYSVVLRCQLPNEDLDVLVSIKSDEDLANVIEEYDRASSISGKDLKIRAILSPQKSSASSSPDSSASSSSGADLSPPRSYRPRSPTIALFRRFPARKPPCAAVREFYHRYPCHLQANSRPASYFSQQCNHWN
ncbi:hypothetical protein Cgig2_004120 [Carnegiea gigantea]|uniref:PB1 domain-containing protein n=1 Tax=Carnegiea gigantea TaxID=171969 RepID=A0A9Q1KU09_9CARY|nr:hypothetical protein Cgig2_004120 [Carnegiea gigantea]